MSTSAQYDLPSTRGYAYLRRKENAIDVYVEDVANDLLYTRLINNALDGKASISCVFGLGGRKNVLEAAVKHVQNRRPAIYIVDGDLYLWTPENEQLPQNVHRLSTYCVENLVLEPRAIKDVVLEHSAETEDAAEAAVSEIQGLLAQAEAALLSLYATFAALFHEGSPQRTVTHAVDRWCQDSRRKGMRITRRSLAAFTRALLQAESTPTAVLRRRRRELLRTARQRKLTARELVSGKNALLPLAQSILSRKYGVNLNRRTLSVRLSKDARLELDPVLRRRLYSLLPRDA